MERFEGLIKNEIRGMMTKTFFFIQQFEIPGFVLEFIHSFMPHIFSSMNSFPIQGMEKKSVKQFSFRFCPIYPSFELPSFSFSLTRTHF